MKIISVSSLKGGVGKTSLTFGLGQVLTDAGNKVLLIDADSNNNLTEHCLKTSDLEDVWERNLYHFLYEDKSIHNVLHDGIYCDIIPATLELTTGSTGTAGIDPDNIKRLNNALKKTDYDYVLIDTTPHLSKDLFMTLSVCDLVLQPIGKHLWAQKAYQLTCDVLDEIGTFTKRPDLICVPSIVTQKQYDEIKLINYLPMTTAAILKSMEVWNAQDQSKPLRRNGKTYNRFVELAKEVC